MNDDKNAETTETEIRIFMGDWEELFLPENIGPKIENREDFLRIVEESIKFTAPTLGNAWEFELQDYECRACKIHSGICVIEKSNPAELIQRKDCYGQIVTYAKRGGDEATWALVVVETREDALGDGCSEYELSPEAYDELEKSDYTHVIVHFNAHPAGYEGEEDAGDGFEWEICAD